MITVTINDQEVSVEDGTLILEAAKQIGIHIPTFCYQPILSRLASCRICLVEIEGQRKLQPSCVTPVMPGMRVQTESRDVKEARIGVLEFFLSNHALDCPVCDKGGECELQNMVHKYGPRKGQFAEKKERFHEKDYRLSPVIIKNSNRCVQCLRCVRVCDEAVGRSVLGAMGRGTHQEETSFLKSYMDCDHCGNCIEVCPVGCFMRLPYRYKARPWDLNSASTICPFCATGCRMDIQERGGEYIRAISKFGKGVNSELMCARGRFGFDFLNSKDRLTTPLRKKEDGTFEEITWEEALKTIKANFKLSSPERIGAIISARNTNEEFYLLQKFMRKVLKSNNIDSSPRWSSDAVSAYVTACGINEGGTSIADSIDVDTVLITGSQISDENPVTDYLLRRAFDTRRIGVIIASPRAMKLDSSAQMTLRNIPASDGTLLKAVVAELYAEKPEAFNEVTGLEKIKGLDSAVLSKECGVALDDIKATAGKLLKSAQVSILAGTEYLRFPESLEGLVFLRDALRALKKDLKILPLLDRCNQRGAWDMGIHPAFTPGYEALEKEGLGCDRMIQAAEDRQLDMLYVICENVAGLYPDAKYAVSALSKLKFLVVQDVFMSETAKLAHIVLPGAAFAEKEGSFTNQEGRAQKIDSLLPPPGVAKTALEVIAAVGRELDYDFGPSTAVEVLAEIREATSMYRDVEIDTARNDSALVKGKPAALRIANFLGKKRFDYVEADDSPAKPAPVLKVKPQYFKLVTGNHLLYSGTIARKSETLRNLIPGPVVEVSVSDADKLGLSDGDTVRVKGKYHEAVLNLKTKKGSRDGIAFIPENFTEIGLNRFLKRGEGIQEVTIRKI